MHQEKLKKLNELIEIAYKKQDLTTLRAELSTMNAEMSSPTFWNDKDHAQSVSKKAGNIQKAIDKWENVKKEVYELMDLLPEIKDPTGAQEFREMVDALEAKWDKLEVETYFSGKHDRANAILSIHAGTGGTDAQDFAEMLMRMYLRFIEKPDQHGEIEWTAAVIDESRGEEAGIKSVTIAVEGDAAYGYMKGESGVHRLVRLSPFNAGGTRETSFVLVEILPDLSEDAEAMNKMKIDAADLRIDVFRSSGPGGQSVNKTDSAVRITHIPTGLVVTCQNERSQLQNKEQAMKILRAKLVDLMEKEKVEELSRLRGGKQEMTFGSQIRSYVLHPYKMVKDHRTDYEEGNPEKVLDGDLAGFIEAELRK